MADRIFKTEEQLKSYLASNIADDRKSLTGETKFKFQRWHSGGGSHLIKMSEHGWELSDIRIDCQSLADALLNAWRKNRWDEPIGSKTAAQIARKLGWDLTVEVAQAIVRIEKEERNHSRNSINYYTKQVADVEKEFNEYLEKRYPGNLEGMPRPVVCKVTITFTDADGNECVPQNMEEEA